jgi:signal transduction histidine kinase
MSQTGKIIFKPAKIELFPIVDSVIKTLNSASNLKEIHLQNLIPNNFEIFADANMLNAIFQNLISNAIKYTLPGGEVKISAEIKNGMTYITVSDTGVGMDEDTMAKLFRIDQQSSIPGTENEKGSGLGLILCKDFIEKHNGEIRVESEPSKGSHIIFSIPNQDSV